MYIGSSTTTWQASATAASRQQYSRSKKSQNDGATDRVDISDTARKLYAEKHSADGGKIMQLPEAIADSLYTTESTLGKTAGANSTGLRKYMNLGSGNGNVGLTAMNMSRKSLGGRIDSIIKGLGINLGKGEKLTISVDGKNQVVVGGIKDKDKAKAIQDALNKDEKIGRDLRKHVANAKINEYANKQSNYEKQMSELGIDVRGDLGEDPDASFTSSGMRSLIIEEYLQENAGIGLADLSIEKGADGTVSILGMNSELSALLAEDKELGDTIANILENGQAGSEFKASFEFANGTISDSSTADAAKNKIEGVKAKLMGEVDPETGTIQPGIIDLFREKISAAGGEMDEKLMEFLSRGFSIRVTASGSFELIGAEELSGHLQDTLKGLVQKALDDWAKDPKADPTEANSRVANFIDVAETFIEQHRFEHGDVDEYQHLVEIDFRGAGDLVKVVSPEADKAQDEANQAVADKLGDKLMGMLAENGVNTEGLSLEIDEKGKITVLGDPANADIKKAQGLIDQFVQETKGLAAKQVDGDKQDKTEAEKEGRAIRGGGDDDAGAQAGAVSSNVVASGDDATAKANEWKRFVAEMTEKVRPYLPDPEFDTKPGAENSESKRIRDIYVGWQKNMPRDNESHFLGNVAPVSSIRAPKFASILSPDGEGKVTPFGNRADSPYSDDAQGLYMELMDGMTQFHDERRKVTYRMGGAAA